MKKRITILLLLCLILINVTPDEIVKLQNGKKVLLLDDFTWIFLEESNNEFDFNSIKDNQIPNFLRGGIKCNSETIKIAVEMYFNGWRYTMPRPKSAQARWGNYDGRTTWYNGYWYNEKTKLYSKKTPHKIDSTYVGDRQNNSRTWRNGGSPPFPAKIEWLLSEQGGAAPQ
ncbi:MAG: hypothetical protein GXP33_01380 [Spirochaetes bacterium]|nr:hypothetical protein [Spirochaetota bacterium]